MTVESAMHKMLNDAHWNPGVNAGRVNFWPAALRNLSARRPVAVNKAIINEWAAKDS